MKKPWGLHWFRRDLRVLGNPALLKNHKIHEGRVLGVFCIDENILKRPDFSPLRFAFFLKTLAQLKGDLRNRGGDLLIVSCPPLNFFKTLLKNNSPAMVSWNRDYEPYARERDRDLKEFLESHSTPTLCERDHLFFEPHEVLSAAGEPYKVFTPFAKTWFKNLKSPEGRARLLPAFDGNDLRFSLTWRDLKSAVGDLPLADPSIAKVALPLPEAGSRAAREALENFRNKAGSYATARDFPFEDGTSKLSFYLKTGSLTTAQIISELNLRSTHWDDDSGPTRFLKELIWREFYHSILFHWPQVEHSAFQKKYRSLSWANDKEAFSRWKEGRTGFPIVDAGMRQLSATGWMHNRIRMIVASFLTKDLLIDWRWGERHFMNHLLDGDLAANNGGWQWAASTGCDPQPYFRVFNPWRQGARFDPEGDFIRSQIPELRGAEAKTLHEADEDRSHFGYPKPMVDHAQRARHAISFFKRTR